MPSLIHVPPIIWNGMIELQCLQAHCVEEYKNSLPLDTQCYRKTSSLATEEVSFPPGPAERGAFQTDQAVQVLFRKPMAIQTQ